MAPVKDAGLELEPARDEDLRAGDVVAPWGGRRARIVSIAPYRGPLGAIIFATAVLSPEGADGFRAGGMSLERGGTTMRVQ